MPRATALGRASTDLKSSTVSVQPMHTMVRPSASSMYLSLKPASACGKSMPAITLPTTQNGKSLVT